MTIAKRHDRDMTQGSIVRNLILFTLPLLAGNLFQQFYNMVDTWVIGQTGENNAFAAVGSVAPIINILIGFFPGLASGAGVVISQYYGAKREEEVQRATHTALCMTLVLGVVFTVIGVVMAPWMLQMMLHTDGGDDGVYPFAKTYLTIYFAGVIGLMIYNMVAGILRAVGDSKRPFYFLIVSALTNVVLDLLFVFSFEMGVAGVAYATVIAQGISAVLILITLHTTPSPVRIRWSAMKIDWSILRQIVKVGIPAAIQMALTAFSNVFVQSYIAGVNANQTYCLGGWTSYTKIDHFLFLPVQSIGLAVTTFVGQNLGNNDPARARRGTYIAMAMAFGINIVLITLVMLFAPTLAGIFNPDEQVAYYAEILLRHVTPFYILTCINQIVAAALRGAGNARAPMLIMLGSFVGFRQLYLFIVSNYIANELLPVAMGYPVGWLVCAIVMFTYFVRHPLDTHRLVKQEASA